MPACRSLVCCAILSLQPPWATLDAWIDSYMLSSLEIEALSTQLETVCRVLEEECDYPIEHVAAGGSITSDTAVRGNCDVILVVVMKEFELSMVRRCNLNSNGSIQFIS